MFKKLNENWALKLLALVFACILWFFVTGEQKLERSYAVPLQLKNMPAGMMVANDIPNMVDVRISGPRTLLMNLQLQDIGIAVNLKDLEPGLTTLKRLEERLNLPGPLKVTRLSPSYIDVKLERVVSKNVEVKPQFSGKPAAGYRVAAVRVEPALVMIEGAESEVAVVDSVATETVDLADALETRREKVSLSYPGRYSNLKNHLAVEMEIVIEPTPKPQ
ncbi:MAG: YbbR domain pair protein [Desulfuromonadales bacterium C00003096]|jgi:YbbR domain-containing protein|nr:MAG: YbbR domain pair protein [Desulfuromonadales bacterium C00003096]